MTQTDGQIGAELDRIERSIDIDASAEKVWSLITRPGWWINEDDVDPDPEMRPEGELRRGRAPEARHLQVPAPSSATSPGTSSYHWVDNVAPEAGTTVTFWIEDRPGGVPLRVVESGFAGLKKDRAAIDNQIKGTADGWELELEAAKRFVLGDSGSAA